MGAVRQVDRPLEYNTCAAEKGCQRGVHRVLRAVELTHSKKTRRGLSEGRWQVTRWKTKTDGMISFVFGKG